MRNIGNQDLVCLWQPFHAKVLEDGLQTCIIQISCTTIYRLCQGDRHCKASDIGSSSFENLWLIDADQRSSNGTAAGDAGEPDGAVWPLSRWSVYESRWSVYENSQSRSCCGNRAASTKKLLLNLDSGLAISLCC